jgi:TDG/mug DNA glycosylase family protein
VRGRRALGVQTLGPEHDAALLGCGIGFTDVVKKPSANASTLTPADFAEWAPRLAARLHRYRPRVVCFHGLTAYRPFAEIVLRVETPPVLGPQPVGLGPCRLFVVPNPSPANAHFTVEDQRRWYDRLARFVAET